MNESISISFHKLYGLNRRRKLSKSWFELKCHWVDKIKSAALANFQRTPSGEIIILKLYLRAEELAASSGSFSLDSILMNAPEWLCKEMEIHEKEEARHVRIFEKRIESISQSDGEVPLYLFSERKIIKFHSLARKFENRFEFGMIVPALVVALILENLGVRIFKRHLRVLNRIATKSPTVSLLSAVIKDEKRHIRGFLKSLRKLVKPSEYRDYRRLRDEAFSLEHKGGLTSAVTMFVLSLLPSRLLLKKRR